MYVYVPEVVDLYWNKSYNSKCVVLLLSRTCVLAACSGSPRCLSSTHRICSVRVIGGERRRLVLLVSGDVLLWHRAYTLGPIDSETKPSVSAHHHSLVGVRTMMHVVWMN